MPSTLSIVVKNISRKIPNQKNVGIINDYYGFMKETGNSDRYIKDCLKCMITFSIYLNKNAIDRVNKKETILTYLKLKEKSRK